MDVREIDETSFATLYCVVDTGMLRMNTRIFSLRSVSRLSVTSMTFSRISATTRMLPPTKNAMGLHGDNASDSTPSTSAPKEERPREPQILQHELPNDGAGHVRVSLRLNMTFATKISSSDIRWTSRTVAPALVNAAAISSV